MDHGPSGAVALAFLGLLVAGAAWDLWRYLIPNSICAALVGLFALWAALAPGEVDWLSHGGAGLAALAGGGVLFRLGKLGGGDVKFLAAAALWAGFEHLLPLLVYTALAGGVLALGLVAARRAIGALPGWAGPDTPIRPRFLRIGEAVPYGVAIAGAALYLSPRLPVLQGAF
ncbi:MAG: prepilin peptidase [Kiloniellaceae bacterium]